MATFIPIADFIEAAMEGLHDLSSDTIQIALSNTAPASESSNPTATGNGVLANVTQLNAGSYTNYDDDMTVDRVCENVTSDEASGTYKFDADDIVITATGGAMSPFRYVYLFNQTSTGDLLMGCWDYGSALTLAENDSATLGIHTNGFFGVAQT